MKKILSVALIIFSLILTLPLTSCGVNKVESTEGLHFELNADQLGYTLVDIGTCTAQEIVVNCYKGLPVTAIGSCAFANCKNVTKITLDIYDLTNYLGPNYQKSSPNSGISLNDNYVTYSIPDSKINVGSKEIILAPPKNEIVSDKTYIKVDDDSTISSIIVSDSSSFTTELSPFDPFLTSYKTDCCIGDFAFWGCDKLEEIVIGKEVSSIAPNSFAFCNPNVKLTNNSKLTENEFIKAGLYSNSASYPEY